MINGDLLPKPLWDHQLNAWAQVREQFAAGHRSVLMQLVTGTGKTRLVGGMTNQSIEKRSRIAIATRAAAELADDYRILSNSTVRKNRVWFVVPRKELLWQASDEFKGWVPTHGKIGDGREEGDFQVHVCSRDTLIRRIREDKIKNYADFIVFDEAHIALKQQIEIKAACHELTFFLGITATPQQTDGTPMTNMYDVAVMGPQLQWFVESGFLKKPMVYGLPTDLRPDYSDCNYTKKGDLDKNSAAQINALMKAQAKGGFIFGNSIDLYGDISQNRPFLNFCQSVALAEVKAEEFRRKGFKVESIDGNMSNAKRKGLIDAVKSGDLIGLTACDLPTYGLDVPGISCVLFDRKTMSVSLYMQMIGRGLRYDDTWPDCHIHDNVGNCSDPVNGGHGHPLTPRVWNFDGKVKKKKIPDDAVESVEAVGKCPVCYDLIIKRQICRCGNVFDIGKACDNCNIEEYEIIMACRTCGAQKETKTGKPVKKIDGFLVEITGPTIMSERPPENRREYQFKIKDAISRFQIDWYPNKITGSEGGDINKQAVRDLLEVGHELDWKNCVMQVYYKMCRDDDSIVNVSLLQEIAEIKEYSPFWVTRKREFLENKFKSEVA